MLVPHMAAFSPDASVKSIRSCRQSSRCSLLSIPARYFRTLVWFLFVFSSAIQSMGPWLNINVTAKKCQKNKRMA